MVLLFAGATIVVDIVAADLNAIKQKQSLCHNANGEDCFLRFTTQFIKDTFGNGVVPVVAGATSTGPKPARLSPRSCFFCKAQPITQVFEGPSTTQV